MKEKIFKGLTLFITVVFILEMLPLQALALDKGKDLKSIYDNKTCYWGTLPEGRTTADNLFTQEIYLPVNKFSQILGRRHTSENSVTAIGGSISSDEWNNGRVGTRVTVNEIKQTKETYCCCLTPEGKPTNNDLKLPESCTLGACQSSKYWGFSPCTTKKLQKTKYIATKTVAQYPVIYYEASMTSEATSELTSRASGPKTITTTPGELGWCTSQNIGSFYMPRYQTICKGTTGGEALPADVEIKGLGMGWFWWGRQQIQYYFTPSGSPTVQETPASQLDSTKIVTVNNSNDIVKAFTWVIQGDDEECSRSVAGICTENKKTAWALMKGAYLTGSGSVFDLKFWDRETKTASVWSAWFGFLFGFILNIVTGGLGFLFWGLFTIGDLVTVAGFFIQLPAVDVSSITVDGVTITPCSLNLPPPTAAGITCNQFVPPQGNGAIQTSLQITPDINGTGLVTGYNLYRDEALIDTEDGLSVSAAQTPINYTDTDNALQAHKTYTYKVMPISKGTAVSANCDIPTKILPTCSLSASPSTVLESTNTTLSWNCSNYNYVDTCSLSGGALNLQGLSPQGSSQQTPVNEKTTYYLTCKNTSYPEGVTVSTTVNVTSSVIHE